MNVTRHSGELTLIGLLAVGDAFFAWWVIPASVEDPEGFGIAQGLAPSTTLHLIAGLAGLVLACRLIGIARAALVGADHAPVAAARPPSADEQGSWRRVTTVIGVYATFALLALPWLGFYASSFGFVLALVLILGERRAAVVIATPVLLTGLVYGLFEGLFSIALPRGELIETLIGG